MAANETNIRAISLYQFKMLKCFCIRTLFFFLALFQLSINFAFSQGISTEPLVTNVFYETDIREALRDISAQVSIPLIPDASVQGTITVKLERVPLEKAIQMIISAGGYTFRKLDGYYLIGLSTSTNPTFNYLTTTELIKPKYLKAQDFPPLLSDFYRDYVHVNERTNTLTITASSELIERIKKDIAKIDLPPQQVMVETLVTEISKDALEDLGVNWSWQWQKTSESSSTAEGMVGIEDFISDLRYTTTGEFTREILASLHLLIEKGKASVRANPRIATLDGQEASIHIGKEEYHLIDVGTPAFPYRNLQAIQAGITLKITPYISEPDDVHVYLYSEVSDITTKFPEGLPIVSKRTAQTSVRVKDGQTIIIGGLLQENTQERIKKVPFLGSLPILGALFRSKEMVTSNNELVIFVTPHILGEKKSLSYQGNQQLKSSNDWAEYIQTVHKVILEKIKNLPYKGKPKNCTVTFVLTKDGKVKDVNVEMKEDDDELLEGIISQCINTAVSYPPFPRGVKEEEKQFSLSITFEESDAQSN